MPKRDEETLRDVLPKKAEALVEECVKGLPILRHVIRRWLRSVKASEPDVRPLAKLQNEDSQKRYAVYITRFICYTLRRWKSREEVENAGYRGPVEVKGLARMKMRMKTKMRSGTGLKMMSKTQ